MDAGKPVYLQYGDDVLSLFAYMKPDKSLQWMGKLTKDKWMVDKSIENGDYIAYLVWFRDYIAQLAVSKDPPLASKAPAYLMYFTNPIFRAVGGKVPTEGLLTVEALLDTFSRPDGSFLFPTDVVLNLHAYLANTYRLEKNYTKAFKYINKLISLSPFDANSYFILGLIYDNQHKKDEALASWKTATTLDIYNVKYIYNYHLALAKYKSIPEAISFLEGRAQEFEKEKALNLRDLVLKFRDCFFLPPEETGDLDVYGLTKK
jgi:tetratricopeptide (TPR) repeat protein